MDNKQNDWVLEILQNPEFTQDDFANVGVTPQNTSIYDKDRYINSKTIQALPQFQTQGAFDVAKFTNFYNSAKQSYQEMGEEDYAKTEQPKAIFNYNNLWVPKEERGKDVDFSVVKIDNPNRQRMGMEGFGFISAPTMTPQEIAQNEQVYNPKTGEWEESPNDSWLLRDWFDPVVMATYDYDVDANGNPTSVESEIVHRKGEYKINPETGTYYYEKLNGRTPYGKQVLSPFDILTRDGSVANKYDFFDSDGVDKSFVGSVMKTAARLVPMLIQGIGTPYIALNIATELGKVMPIIYKTTFGLGSDNEFMNTIEGIAASFSANQVSQAGSQSFFNSENILNLIGDVAKQLYEQRWLFSKAPALFKEYSIVKDKKLGKSALDLAQGKKAGEYLAKGLQNGRLLESAGLRGETAAIQNLQAESFAKAALWAEKYQKEYQELGRNISRLYMTTTASYQAYQDAKAEGASDMEAAMVFWGYLAGEYAIISSELGEHVLPELRAEKSELKNLVRTVSGVKGGNEIVGIAKDRIEQAKGLRKMFLKASDLAIKTAKKGIRPTTVGMNSLFANALGEGIEELSEEVWYDVTRGTFNALQFLSGREFKLNVFDNWAERYAQSFFGGALGGALFEGINNIENKRLYNPGVEAANQQLIYHIRNGRGDEIRDILKNMHTNNAFGNPNLSALPKTEENGALVYGEGTPEDNQNTAGYKAMLNYVNNIEYVLNKENMNIPDYKLITGDDWDTKDIIRQARYQVLMNSPIAGEMMQDWNNMANEFLTIHSEINRLNSADDATKKSQEWQDDMAKQQALLNEVRKKREEFFTPESQMNYVGAMIFASSPEYNRAFANTTFRDYAENKYNKKFEDLSDLEKKWAKDSYQQYLAYSAEKKITAGHRSFLNLNKKLSTKLQALGENGYKIYSQGRLKLLETEFNLTTGEKVNLLQILDRLYDRKEDVDDLVETAQYLKTVFNPFEELNRLFYKQKENKNPKDLVEEFNLKDIHSILLNIVDNLKKLGSEYIDSEVVKTIKGISDTLLKINMQRWAFSENAIQSLPINEDTKEQFYSDFDNLKNSSFLNVEENYDKLLSKIDSIIDSLKQTQPDSEEIQFLEDLKTIITKDFDSLTSDLDAQDNINYKQELKNVGNEINSLLQKSYTNPIASLLQDLKIGTDSKAFTILELISKASDVFQDKSIKDFVLDGELSIDDIRQAKEILAQIESVIRAAQVDNIDATNPFGYNAVYNKYLKDAGKGDQLLGEIDTQTAALMIQDLGAYYKKLDFFEKLHNLNQESSLRAQGRIGQNMLYLSYDVIGKEDSSLYKTLENGEVKDRTLTFTVDDKTITETLLNDKIKKAIDEAETIKRYYSEEGRPVDVGKDENIMKMHEEILNLETAVHERIKELTDQYGYQAVFSQIMPHFINMTKLSINNSYKDKDVITQGISESTISFNDSDRLAYFASICAVNPKDFEYYYNETLKADGTGIAPIPAQKFTVRLLFSEMLNKDLCNNIVEATGVSDRGVSIVKNAVFATGVPGSGKTSACARFAFNMFKHVVDKPKVWCIGPAQTQADNLAKSLGVDNEDTKNYTKEKIFQILGIDNPNSTNYIELKQEDIKDPYREGLIKKELESINAQYNGKTNYMKVKDGVVFNTIEKPDAIFIDEVTHLTSAELLILSKYAEQNNIPLLLFGDLSQSGDTTTKIKFNEKEISVRLSYTFALTSPKLTVSMRVTNSNKRDNSYGTKQMAERFPSYPIFAQYMMEHSIDDALKELRETLHFKYTETDKGIYGDKVVNPSDLTEEKIKTLVENLEEGEKIGFIYSDTESPTYKLMKQVSQLNSDKIDFIHSINFFDEVSAQGNEAQFFIIDLQWANRVDFGDLTPDDKYLKWQSLVQGINTTVTRSKQGSYIVNNGFTNIVPETNFEEVPFEAVSEVADFKNDTTLQNFKKKTVDMMSAILNGYTPNKLSINNIPKVTSPVENKTNTPLLTAFSPTTPREEVITILPPGSTEPEDTAVEGGYEPAVDEEPTTEESGEETGNETTEGQPEEATGENEPSTESDNNNDSEDSEEGIEVEPQQPQPINPSGGSGGAAINPENNPPTTQLLLMKDFDPYKLFADNPNCKICIARQDNKDEAVKILNQSWDYFLDPDFIEHPKWIDNPETLIAIINDQMQKNREQLEYRNGAWIIYVIPNDVVERGEYWYTPPTRSFWIRGKATHAFVRKYVKFGIDSTSSINYANASPKTGWITKFHTIYTAPNGDEYILTGKDEINGKYLLQKINGGLVSIPKEEFESTYVEKQKPPLNEASQDDYKLLNSATDAKEFSQLEFENVLKRIQNDEMGMLLYPHFGFIQGIGIEDPDPNGDVYKITKVSYGKNLSDLGAILGLTPQSLNQTIKKSDYQKAVSKLAEIRSYIIQSNNLDDIEHYVKSTLGVDGQGGFFVRIHNTYGNSDPTDTIINNINDSSIINNIHLVYSIGGIDITLATIQGLSAIEGYPPGTGGYKNSFIKKLQDSGADQQTIEKAKKYFDEQIALAKKFKTVKQTLRYDKNRQRNDVKYISIPEFIMGEKNQVTSPRLFTLNTNARKTTEQLEKSWQTLDSLKKNPSLLVSDPMIITGANAPEELKGKFKNGQVVVFVTDNLHLTVGRSSVKNDPNLLAQVWLENRQNGTLDNEQVRIVFATPIGSTFKQYLQSVIDFYNNYHATGEKGVQPIGNTFTPARLLQMFIDIDSDITDELRSPGNSVNFKGQNRDYLSEIKQALDDFLSYTIVHLQNWDILHNNNDPLAFEKQLMFDTTGAINEIKLNLGRSTGEQIRGMTKSFMDNIVKVPETSTYLETLAGTNSYNIAQLFTSYFSYPDGNGVRRFITKDMAIGSSETAQFASTELLLNFLDKYITQANYIPTLEFDGRKINFNNGIYFQPIYRRSKKKGARIPQDWVYLAASEGQYQLDVWPQSSTFALDSKAFNALQSSINLQTQPESLFKLTGDLPIHSIVRIDGKLFKKNNLGSIQHTYSDGNSRPSYLFIPYVQNGDFYEPDINEYGKVNAHWFSVDYLVNSDGSLKPRFEIIQIGMGLNDSPGVRHVKNPVTRAETGGEIDQQQQERVKRETLKTTFKKVIETKCLTEQNAAEWYFDLETLKNIYYENENLILEKLTSSSISGSNGNINSPQKILNNILNSDSDSGHNIHEITSMMITNVLRSTNKYLYSYDQNSDTIIDPFVQDIDPVTHTGFIQFNREEKNERYDSIVSSGNLYTCIEYYNKFPTPSLAVAIRNIIEDRIQNIEEDDYLDVLIDTQAINNKFMGRVVYKGVEYTFELPFSLEGSIFKFGEPNFKEATNNLILKPTSSNEVKQAVDNVYNIITTKISEDNDLFQGLKSLDYSSNPPTLETIGIFMDILAMDEEIDAEVEKMTNSIKEYCNSNDVCEININSFNQQLFEKVGNLLNASF